MPIKFSIDRISPDGLIASANNISLIIKNQETSQQLLPKYDNQHAQCFVAGRYLSFYYLRVDELDNTKGDLMQVFFDCKKDRDNAIFICNSLVNQEERILFMQLFEECALNYDRDYNTVELVLDETEGQHFLSGN